MRAAILFLAMLGLATSSANAALIPNAIPGVTGIGSAIGDGADPGDGSHSRVVGGNGLTVGNPLNSSTWTHDNSWQNGWQHKLSQSGTFILDLAAVHSDLKNLYIWNVTESGAENRGARDIEIYYSATPTVTPVKYVTYDFTSGGWSSLTSLTLTQGSGGGASQFNGLVNLSSIPAARYIGIKMLNNYSGGDIGLAEVQATVVPEPSTVALFGISLLGLTVLRRKRK